MMAEIESTTSNDSFIMRTMKFFWSFFQPPDSEHNREEEESYWRYIS